MSVRVAAIALGAVLVVGARASMNADRLLADPPAAHLAHLATTRAAVPTQGSASRAAGTKRDDLPAADETARATLDKSPRHGEWVGVFDGLLTTRTFIVHPQRGGRSPFVIVISDNRAMSDWIRAVGDQLAQEGFTALVPDLLSGAGPNGGNTESFEGPDAVTRAIGNLTTEQVMKRLNVVWDFGMRLPGMTGKGAVIGFGWGGGQSFTFATEQAALSAAVVFYGTPPSAGALAKINAPVLGVYGGDDARVNATIDPTSAEMKRLGKAYEPIVIAGAGTDFLRVQSGREANVAATQQAWPKVVAFLKEHTK